MKKPRKSKPIGVLTKTFRILQDLQAEPANLTDISRRTAINKSTALRILAHLETEGYVARDAQGAYHTAAPGARSSFEVHLREAAQAPLRELWRITQETVNLGLLDGLEVLYLDSLESPQSFRLVANAGTRAVAYRTALGKAILAHMPAETSAAILDAFHFQPYTP
ncbi:MAG: helix-turn-helix domain-containing protein, partial [Acidobacteria bacterium]|nr:helix-turn-helix domain-containing protein [Acidobacteriota bacterium]